MPWICTENKTQRHADKAPADGAATGKKNIDGQITIILVYPARKCTLVWQWTLLISALVAYCLKGFFI